MNTLLHWLARLLLGPASMTDERLDGITLAIEAEAARLAAQP